MKDQTERPNNENIHDTSSNWGYRTVATAFCAGLLSLTGCAWMPLVGGGDEPEQSEQAEPTETDTVIGAEEEQTQSDESTTASSENQTDETADASEQQSSADQNDTGGEQEDAVADSSSDEDASTDETTDEDESSPTITTGRPEEEKTEVIPGEKTVIDWEKLPE